MSDDPQPCAWCGKPSNTRREVEKEARSIHVEGGLKKRAIIVPVCAEHAAIVDREERIVVNSRIVKRERNKRDRGHKFSLEDLTRAETLLAELEKERGT